MKASGKGEIVNAEKGALTFKFIDRDIPKMRDFLNVMWGKEKENEKQFSKEVTIAYDNTKTAGQGRLFESLCEIYFKSGEFPDKARSKDELRTEIKKRLGAGFDTIDYVTDDLTMAHCTEVSDIPDNVVQNWLDGNKGRIDYHLKSCSKYTKSEYSDMINKLLPEMIQNGCLRYQKFQDILETIKFKE